MTKLLQRSTKSARPAVTTDADAAARTSPTYLPYFSGFYQTGWEWLLSHSETLMAESLASSQPPASEGGLDVDQLSAILDRATNVDRHCSLLAREFCASFNLHLSETVGFETGVVFKKLVSPDFYNFETDRIAAEIPQATMRKLFAASRADGHRKLEASIRESFSPYSGYVPYYSNELADWTGKPVEAWDRNEICTLLDTFVDPEIDDLLFDEIGAFRAFLAFRQSVDWKKFDREIERHRTEAS